MVRSIPPRTMIKVRREQSKGASLGRLGFNISTPFESERRFAQEVFRRFKGKVYRKPRQWRYITKPFFKRIKEPIVDVFKEADEVQIIIDLGNFRKGEFNFGVEDRNYIIYGKHEDFEFREEIPLPYNVDMKKIKEIFRNDILELILPKKTQRKRRRKK